MILNKSSNIIEFDKNNLSREERESLTIPPFLKNVIINGIVKIDNEYYYAKYINDSKMINELIGSYLSKYIGLDTVNYQIGMYKGNMFALSKLFYEKDYEYYNVPTLLRVRPQNLIKTKDNYFQNLYMCKTDALKKVKDLELLEEILKLTTIDLRMGQRDRHVNNVLLKKQNDKINLAPVYDYGYSYISDDIIGSTKFYDSPFIILRKNLFSLKILIKKYPNIINFINKINDINIEDVLIDLESQNNITFTDEEINNVISMDKINRKILKL